MQTATTNRLTKILVLAALAALCLLVAMTLICLPYFYPGEAPAPTTPPTQAPTTPPTEEPTEAPTEEPTEPLLDLPLNPFGKFDFQFRGRYLKCLKSRCRTGVDVSSHQKQIDWAQVKASGVEFAMVRLGYRGYGSGKLVLDNYADANIRGAAEAGLDVGVYFFSQALTVEEAREEAAFVLEALKKYELTMPVVYDWETVEDEDARTKDMNADTLTACSLAFLEAIEEAGYDTMLYFNRHQAQYLLHLEQFRDYDFWLAMYTPRMDYPYAMKMWQYTNRGQVPGIEGHADINILFTDAG